MNPADTFLNEIRNQIDYTNKLEEAYITKHTEIEIIYAMISRLIDYVRSDDSNIAKLNEMVEQIGLMIKPDSNFQIQQKQVLQNSKKILEEINKSPTVDPTVIIPLVSQIDTLVSGDPIPLVEGVKTDRSKKKKAKKRKKSKKK